MFGNRAAILAGNGNFHLGIFLFESAELGDIPQAGHFGARLQWHYLQTS
jgi:hypothetical protein